MFLSKRNLGTTLSHAAAAGRPPFGGSAQGGLGWFGRAEMAVEYHLHL